MTSKDILVQMLDKVKQHQRPKDKLLSFYVEQRLNKSVNTYYNQLMESLNTLKHYDERNVLKKLNKKEL